MFKIFVSHLQWIINTFKPELLKQEMFFYIFSQAVWNMGINTSVILFLED